MIQNNSNSNDEQFQHNDIVWVKIEDGTQMPARVIDLRMRYEFDEDEGLGTHFVQQAINCMPGREGSNDNNNKTLVVLFDKLNTWRWVSNNNLEPCEFLETDISHSHYNQNVLEALAKARQFCKLTFSTTTTKKVTAVVDKPVRLPPGFHRVTPFAVFVKEKMQNTSGERASEAVKKVAKSWKEMSNLDKNPYIENSKLLTEQRKDEFAKLSDQKKEELLEGNALRLEKRKRSTEMEKTQVPKGKEEVIKFGKDFGEQWKVLTADEKKIYLDKAANLKNNYTKELEVWKNINADEISKWNAKLEMAKPKKVVTKPKKMKAVK
uniref:HMG box domain-containing protein n=1 Tax=Meloidogyne javanica TaxID=6303 RepID=A0A915LJZ4_MELJA